MEFSRENLLSLPEQNKINKIIFFSQELIKNNQGKLVLEAKNGKTNFFIKIDKRIQDKLDFQNVKVDDIIKEMSKSFPNCKLSFQKDFIIENIISSIKLNESKILIEKCNGILIDWS
jgi:hypothetical protein